MTPAVLSMGRVGSNAARRWMENAFGERVLHLHLFCLDELHFCRPLDRVARFHAGVGMPDWDAEQTAFCERVRAKAETDLRILVLVREPLARQVSAWRAFRNGEGDFESSFDHAGVAGWFNRQVGWFLGVDVVAGNPSPMRWFRYEAAGLRLAVVRQEDLGRDLRDAGEWLMERKAGVVEMEVINDSPETKEPVVSGALVDRLHGMRWARRFYTEGELSAARGRWVR